MANSVLQPPESIIKVQISDIERIQPFFTLVRLQKILLKLNTQLQ